MRLWDFIVRLSRKLSSKPKPSLTPEQQKKRDIADEVVIINETILRK